jgi:hypothetical protein
MKSHSCNPIYKFLYDVFSTNAYKEMSTSHKKTPDELRILSTYIITSYNEYLEKNHLDDVIKINSRSLTVLLQSIGVEKKRVKIAGKTKEPFIFNKNTILHTLKKLTNLDDDELEDESYDDIIGSSNDQGLDFI